MKLEQRKEISKLLNNINGNLTEIKKIKEIEEFYAHRSDPYYAIHLETYEDNLKKIEDSLLEILITLCPEDASIKKARCSIKMTIKD